MVTSGGTDIDWLIEHNGGFIIFEVKRRGKDTITIRKAQMWLYQALQKQLDKCHIFFIAHEGTDFKNPNDFVYVQELSKLLKDPALQERTEFDDEFEDEEGFRIPISFMEDMTVDELREKIDKLWKEFETPKKI